MEELAYIRKARKRGKNRKVRLALVSDMDNLRLAAKNSRKGKGKKRSMARFDSDADANLRALQKSLNDETFHASDGHDEERRCPCGKVRRLHILPYYPDNVKDHALMQVTMPYFNKAIFRDSSASIKGRGITYAKRRVERWIDEHKSAGRLYFCKLDFVKFYENIDQSTVYKPLARLFGNRGLRYLLRDIVLMLPKGLGIGLYPIQTIANYYTSILCRKVESQYDVKVFIYCDDMIIIGKDKQEVWRAVNYTKWYASSVMHQSLHKNIGVQIIDSNHFLDFVGFRFYFGHTLLRKRIKENFKRKMHNEKNQMRKYRSAMSYKGYMMHCNGLNLWRKTLNMERFDDFQLPQFENRDDEGKRIFDGQRMSASFFAGQVVVFLDVEFDVRSKVHKSGRSNMVSIEHHGKQFKFFTNGKKLSAQLKWCAENNKFPFEGRLKQINQNGTPTYIIVGVNER